MANTSSATNDCTESNWSEFVKEHPEFDDVKVGSISLIASKLRGGIPSRLTSNFTFGTANAVVEVLFDDGCKWICRLRHRVLKEHPHYIKSTMESTVAAMRFVRENTSVPVPNVYDYQTDPTATDIGVCYMFMDSIPGKKRDQFGEKMTEEELTTLYHQLADSAVQLAFLDFPKIGRLNRKEGGLYEIGPFVNEDGTTYGPFTKSTDYYRYLAIKDASSRLKTEGKTSSEILRDRFASYLYETAASKLSLSNCGPFGLVHGDYGVHNFLFDENLKLAGIVDWDSVHSAPVLACCDWPTMTQIRWPWYDEYWPGVREGLFLRQKLFHEGVRAAEKKRLVNVAKFGGKLMSEIVGSEAAIVAQIIDILESDQVYRNYDGRKVFQFLFGNADFDTFRSRFAEDKEIEYS